MKSTLLKLASLVAFITIISMNLKVSSTDSEKTSMVSLENIEALSQGEIIVGPLCWQNSSHLCYVDFDSGFFVLGTKVS